MASTNGISERYQRGPATGASDTDTSPIGTKTTFHAKDCVNEIRIARTAANNGENIDPNFTVMINTQQIYDAIPKQDVIVQTRLGVQNGIIQVPTVNGGGYTLARNLQ